MEYDKVNIHFHDSLPTKTISKPITGQGDFVEFQYKLTFQKTIIVIVTAVRTPNRIMQRKRFKCTVSGEFTLLGPTKLPLS
jgi:hypothetical protein